MHAASREALTRTASHLDTLVSEAGDKIAVSAQIGTDLFVAVDRLDEERALRISVAETSTSAEQRKGIMNQVFAGKVSESALSVLNEAAAQTWSTPRELRTGLVSLGRRALLRGAESQGQLKQVEDELFTLSTILEREDELISLLTDRRSSMDARRKLVADIIYGKVTMFTEALVLQVIGRPEDNPVDDVANLSSEAASLQGREVARVQSATELNEVQQSALAEKLEEIYGRAISIQSEVDPSLLGGVKIRVGSEVIDGSTRGKIARMKSTL